MKKPLIATVVGALIIFIWSAISWMFLPIHLTTFWHTPGQDKILTVLNENLEKSGAYMLPMADNRSAKMFDAEYQSANQKVMEENSGKPFATIVYIKEGVEETPMHFILGYAMNFATVFIVVIFLTLLKEKFTTFFERWTVVMFFAVIISIEYLIGWNWMGHPWHYVRGFLIDAYISFSLCGAWLAWYLGRE